MHLGELVLPDARLADVNVGAVQFDQADCGFAHIGVELRQRLGRAGAQRRADEILERLLLADRPLHQHIHLGDERQRLGERHGVVVRQRRVPQRAHTLVGDSAFVAMVGFGDHNVGPATIGILCRICQAVENGAAAARLVAHHLWLARLDTQVGVGRRSGADALLQERARLFRVRQDRQRRQRRVGGLWRKLQAQLGYIEAPFGASKRLLIVVCRLWFLGQGRDERAAQRHDLRLATTWLSYRQAIHRCPGALLHPSALDIAALKRQSTRREFGDAPRQRLSYAIGVNNRDQPVWQCQIWPQAVRHVRPGGPTWLSYGRHDTRSSNIEITYSSRLPLSFCQLCSPRRSRLIISYTGTRRRNRCSSSSWSPIAAI